MDYLVTKILMITMLATFALTYATKKNQNRRAALKPIDYSEVVYDSNGFPRQFIAIRQQQAARARATQENYLLF